MARSTKRRELRHTVAVVGDGQTERIYFADIRDTDRPKNLSIFPDYPRKIGSFRGVLERAIELAGDYDTVFALIDMGKIIQDAQLSAYARMRRKAEGDGVVILENNPCFEIWLLLHFLFTGRPFDRCGEVMRELAKKEHLPGYDKSEKYLKNARLYKSYKHLIAKNAIPNARLLESNSEGQDDLYPKAQIFKFFEWYLNVTH